MHSPYIYATLLSKHLLPFGYQKLNMVALPAKQNEGGKLEMLEDVLAYAVEGNHRSFTTWFERTSKIWDEHKKTNIALNERYDYLKLLTKQNATDRFRVIYGGSGTNIACCVLALDFEDLWIYRRCVRQFIVDTKTYYFSPDSLKEAHYLCAVLNSPYVNESIKKHQSQGLWGERDIHRTPFEACAIPIFDADNPDHLELARLSQEAHDKIEEMKGMEENRLLNGGPGRARGRAREILADEIDAIDMIARRLLGGLKRLRASRLPPHNPGKSLAAPGQIVVMR